MARRSIGELVAIVSADTEQFNKGISDMERKLTGLGKMAASPLKFGLGLGASLAALTDPIETITKPLSKLGNLLGGGEFGELWDPENAKKHFGALKDQMIDLGRESRRFGMDPQALLSVEKMAGPDAEGALKALGKLMTQVGGGSDEFVAKLEKWGLSFEELRASRPEELLGKLADAYKALDDPLDKAAMRFDLAGKSGAALHKILAGGAAAIDKYVEKIKELGQGRPEQIALSELINKFEKEERNRFAGYTAKSFESYGAASLLAAKMREEAPLFSGDYLEAFALSASAWKAQLFGGNALLPPGQINEYQRLLADLTKEKPSAEEIAKRLAAEQQSAEADRLMQEYEDLLAPILRINDALDEQEQLLRLTERGWGGVEKEMLALQRAVEAGGDIFAAMEVMDRLAGVAARKEAEVNERSVGEWERKIIAEMSRAGRVSEFAPSAILGSQEAAQSFNRQMGYAAPNGGNIGANLDAIAEQMKKPALSPELQDRIRTIAIEVKKFNDNLKVQGPVN